MLLGMGRQNTFYPYQGYSAVVGFQHYHIRERRKLFSINNNNEEKRIVGTQQNGNNSCAEISPTKSPNDSKAGLVMYFLSNYQKTQLSADPKSAFYLFIFPVLFVVCNNK